MALTKAIFSHKVIVAFPPNNRIEGLLIEDLSDFLYINTLIAKRPAVYYQLLEFYASNHTFKQEDVISIDTQEELYEDSLAHGFDTSLAASTYAIKPHSWNKIKFIHKATSKDIAALTELRLQNLLELGSHPNQEDLDWQIERDLPYTHVVRLKDTLIGYATLADHPTLRTCADIPFLYIVPEHRNKHYGRALLEQMIAFAEKKQADLVFMPVYTEAAHRLATSANMERSRVLINVKVPSLAAMTQTRLQTH